MSESIQVTKEHLVELKMEIELLKRDISYITSLFNKMDSLILKIENQQDKISEKTGDLIEQKVKCAQEELSDLYDNLQKVENNIHSRINSIENILLTEIKKIGKDLNDHINDENTLLKRADKLKYILVGAIAIFIWVIKNFDVIEKVFGK